MKDVFIVDAIRTAVGNFGGSLAPVRRDDLDCIENFPILAV